jgi:hypothetical protein
MNKLLEQLDIQNKHLEKLEKQNDVIVTRNKEIEKENKELKGSTIIGNNKCTTNNTNNTTNNTQNNINNTNNINIVAFGQEDLSYLSDKICKNICGTGYQSPINLIKEIHFPIILYIIYERQTRTSQCLYIKYERPVLQRIRWRKMVHRHQRGCDRNII